MTLALTFSVINVLLAFGRQNHLEVYFIINVLAFLIITLFARLNPDALAKAHSVSAVVLVGFLFVFILKVIAII